MVDAITGFVVNKIGDYLLQEASLLLGVNDELTELKEELQLNQGFLKDAEARQDEDNSLKEWIKLVKDIAYDIEDILDDYSLKVENKHDSSGGFTGTTKKWCCGICVKSDEYDVAKEIQSLKKRILNISRMRETYSISNINGSQERASTRLRQLRRAPSVIEEEHVIGLEDDANIILAKLLNGGSQSYMISIFGMGGLGKTALARKLYNSNDVKARFEYRGWTYVSQEYKTRDLLLRIIKDFGGLDEETPEAIERKSVEDLEVCLRHFLQGKRYLVVIDDVWSKEAWESLKKAFPSNENGSRVIMTTRIKDVAEGADERVYAHNLRFLTFEESWKLFQEKAFRDYRGVDEDLEELGKEMVQKCDGLPLAIIVLAGILSRKRPNEWQKVRDHLWRNLKHDSIHISSVLTLSFNDLPHELKLCFLYFSIFPEDHEISVENLVWLLVAEGFIPDDAEDEEIMEDIAERYIEELIGRSLIQAGKTKTRRLKTCRVHDLLRDLAVKKAKELNFIHVHNGHQRPSLKCRRNVFHYQVDQRHFHTDSSLNRKMRSLLFLEGLACSKPADPIRFLFKVKLLRVLNLGDLTGYSEQISGLPEAIRELIHLRYLRITCHRIAYLLVSISKCRFLQTLDLTSCSLPKHKLDLCLVGSLRHLIGFFDGGLLISDAANLQTLETVTPRTWSTINQEKLINLRELRIEEPYVLGEGNVRLDMGSFSKLRNLRVLTMKLWRFEFSSPDQVPPLQNLVQLSLECGPITRLPGGDMYRMFPNLESLTLDTGKLKEDPMPALEKLPRLEDLYLKSSKITKMICSAKGFGRLRLMKITIPDIEELQIADDAMPSLMEWQHSGNVLKLMIPERLQAIRQETNPVRN